MTKPRDTFRAVRYQDGRQVTYDPTLPLKKGCRVVVVYPPKAEGEPGRVTDVGTLDSADVKSTVLWVTFPMEDGTRQCRIDRTGGAVVARVTGVMTPVPLASDKKQAGRARP